MNVGGVWNGCKAFGRRFAERESPAWIVNMGSEHSLGFAHAGLGFYTASKHAVMGLTDVLRHELPDHVGVSIVCPGLVRSRLWDATRNRPAELGGHAPGADFAAQLMSEGMDAADVGRRVVAGIEAEEFVIATHAHARRYARERWQTIDEAFERQVPDESAHADFEVMAAAGRAMAKSAES